MTDADRIAALEEKIGRLERVVENMSQRETARDRSAPRQMPVVRYTGDGEMVRALSSDEINRFRSELMARDGTVLTPVGYTRDTEQPFTEAEIARMTGGEAA